MEIYGVVSAYKVNGNDALGVTIPKRLREKLKIIQGKQFVVRTDGEGRLIYEPNE
jgi:bifunctional DNA-binding transcriptional regulator/antitoxin component of YhaV-PrlF toxin-antitoxin module